MRTSRFLLSVVATLTAGAMAVGSLAACGEKTSVETSTTVTPASEAPGGVQMTLPTWSASLDKTSYAKDMINFMVFVAMESGVAIDTANVQTQIYEAGQEPEGEISCNADGTEVISKGDSGYPEFAFCDGKIIVVMSALAASNQASHLVLLAWAMADYIAGDSMAPAASCYRGALAGTMEGMYVDALTVTGESLDASVTYSEAEQYKTGHDNGASACVASSSSS